MEDEHVAVARNEVACAAAAADIARRDEHPIVRLLVLSSIISSGGSGAQPT